MCEVTESYESWLRIYVILSGNLAENRGETEAV